MNPFPMKSLLTLPVLAALALTAAACNPVKPPLTARGERFDRPQIDFADEGLRDNVVVEEPIVRRDEFGILRVTVPIRADSNRARAIEYRVTFFDADGAQLSQTTWFAKRLTPNVFDRITFNSTSPRAEDFLLSLAYAK